MWLLPADLSENGPDLSNADLPQHRSISDNTWSLSCFTNEVNRYQCYRESRSVAPRLRIIYIHID